jgi:hypothetical protein
MNCQLLSRVLKETEQSEKIHRGILFDKLCKNDGLFSYMVYLEDLQMISKIVVADDFANYSHQSFRLFLFQDEHCVKQKIKLQLLSGSNV